MTYYNTTNSEGAELRQYQAGADSQEARILEWLRGAANTSTFTPSEVHRRCFHGSVPLTSVRRAMTNLANAGQLSKTSEQRDGPYGRPEYAWKPARPDQMQQELAL